MDKNQNIKKSDKPIPAIKLPDPHHFRGVVLGDHSIAFNFNNERVLNIILVKNK